MWIPLLVLGHDLCMVFASVAGSGFLKTAALTKPADFPVAELVESWTLSLATFYNPEDDLKLIGQYIHAPSTVAQNVPHLSVCTR